MEENRLKPMGDYDHGVFTRIYHNINNLKRKLARGIDHRRFGVDQEEIISWFDVKFLYTFNKYHDKMDENLLQGYIIKSLQLFKFRILRNAYTYKYSQSMVPVEDYTELEEYDVEEIEPSKKEELLSLAMDYMKSILSDNAYLVLEIKLNPPPYITSKLANRKSNNTKIPHSLIADYLGLGDSVNGIKLIKTYLSEIDEAMDKAREHFKITAW